MKETTLSSLLAHILYVQDNNKQRQFPTLVHTDTAISYGSQARTPLKPVPEPGSERLVKFAGCLSASFVYWRLGISLNAKPA
jgi:hypothetical protein